MILTDPEWQAVLLSLKVSSLAVLFSLPFGIFFAWLLVRCTFPGKALLDSVLHLPLVLPPVVVGYLLLVSMGRRGFIGERLYDWFGITFAFSWRGAVLAAAVMSFPLMVRAIRLALGDQHLWVNKLDEPLQAALRIRIQASDVSLVLQPPQQTSIRNVLRAKVVNSYDDNGQVEVELEVGGKTLWARISPWARDELAIKPGLWLYAQIKSVSITA